MTKVSSLVLLILLATVSTFAQGRSAPKVDTKARQTSGAGTLRRRERLSRTKVPGVQQAETALRSKTRGANEERAKGSGDPKRREYFASRSSLAGDDLYYLGMLHHLVSDADAALTAMRLFLKDDPDGQKAQAARNVVVLYAVRKDLLPEAKAAVEAYARHQPQNADDRYRMELVITDGYLRAKDYVSMTAHAKQMLAAAKSFAETNKTEVFRRDEILLKSGVYLSDAYLKTNQKDLALATWTDLRRMSIALPSANLYKETTIRLLRLNPSLERRSTVRFQLDVVTSGIAGDGCEPVDRASSR